MSPVTTDLNSNFVEIVSPFPPVIGWSYGNLSNDLSLWSMGQVDIYETDDHHAYVVEATLPGAKPEQIQITAVETTLTIRVAEKQEGKVNKGNYVRRERYEGEMQRTIVLPTTIEAQKVEATYEHGVLMLHIPKTEAAKPKQISIQVKQAVGSR